MADIWLGRISRWLEKVYNVKGGPLLVDISPSLVAVTVAGDNVEERVPSSWNRFGATNTVPAVAAALGAFRLSNPAGSGALVVIEKATVASLLADSPLIIQSSGAFATPFGGITTSVRLDARTINTSSAASVTFGSAASTSGQAIVRTAYGANASYDFISEDDQELLALPGDAVTIWGATLNQAFFGSFVWRERALETSELT